MSQVFRFWWKLLMFLGVSAALLMGSCVGMQNSFNNRSFIDRQIASEKYGSRYSLSDVDQYLNQTDDFYLGKIQPIFNNRCVMCHSCFNSPCQLNLTSFAGVDRGAIKDDVYDFRLVGDKTPTRLGIDVPQFYDWQTTTRKWREEKYVGKNGTNAFFPVVKRSYHDPYQNLGSSLLVQMISMKLEYKNLASEASSNSLQYKAEESRFCPISLSNSSSSAELVAYQKKFPWAGMPFGFPALSSEEVDAIFDWVKNGSKPPEYRLQREMETPSKPETLLKWEAFLNGQDFAHRITARYIYEHLFLGHLYFEDMPGEFFRLVRSSCDSSGTSCFELPTRRPTDDPKTSSFYFSDQKRNIRYKFIKLSETIVHKSHVPFQLNDAKMKKWNEIFISQISNKDKSFPNYGNKTGGNPFLTFKDIPPKARYQFLLDDSYYFVMSFIKGPVCRGTGALSVIDDHFWVFFLKPDSDVTINKPGFFLDAGENLAVPALDGNDWTFSQLFKQRRRTARQVKKFYLNKYKDKGFSLQDIWDGDGEKTNAVLTIYRHEDSASVSKGAIGEVPKTMWMLDYPIFEDIYYNLVGTYDVYAPIIHSVKSRLHMDASRFNAQDLYLSFLPKKYRQEVRRTWSQDNFGSNKTEKCQVLPPELCAFYSQSANVMRDTVYPYSGIDVDSRVALSDVKNLAGELALKILAGLPEAVTAPTRDSINRVEVAKKETVQSYLYNQEFGIKETDKILSTLGGIKGYYTSFLPELSFVQIVDDSTGTVQWYSMIHNRERYNVSFVDDIAPESTRLRPEHDSVNFVRGFVGSYANAIFTVPIRRLPEFIKSIMDLRDEESKAKLNKKFLVSRHNINFWKYYDNLSFYARQQGITPQADAFEGSILDLNRYINDEGF